MTKGFPFGAERAGIVPDTSLSYESKPGQARYLNALLKRMYTATKCDYRASYDRDKVPRQGISGASLGPHK